MKKQLMFALTGGAILALAGAGIAVNAATLSLSPTSNIGQVPNVLVPSPSPSTTHDATDDNLPQNSGQDDGAAHNAGDDNPDSSNSGSGGSGTDNSGTGSDDSGSGSGSDDSGQDSGDDSGSGGHGSDD
ncbi:MAG: hypothetical protein ABI435_07985 [Pseudolysinimonas sp.]